MIKVQIKMLPTVLLSILLIVFLIDDFVITTEPEFYLDYCSKFYNDTLEHTRFLLPIKCINKRNLGFNARNKCVDYHLFLIYDQVRLLLSLKQLEYEGRLEYEGWRGL